MSRISSPVLRRAVLVLFSFTVCAVAAQAENDVALSAVGVFAHSTTGNGTTQTPSDQGGFLIEARHISNPLFGLEAAYGFNRANQRYAGAGVCALGCSTTTGQVAADQHELTASYVVSLKLLMFRPFAQAGGGVLVTSPEGGTTTTTSCGTLNPLCSVTTSPASTQTSAKGEFVYGAGVDWALIPHVGVRLQYRGRVAKVPDIASAFTSTNAFVRSAVPAVGVFLRF